MARLPRLRAFARKVSRDDVVDRSSGLAFQMLASLLPMLALAYYVFAQLKGFEKLQTMAEHYAMQSLAPGLGRDLSQVISSVETGLSPSAIGIFGVVGFLYSGVIMIAKIETYLNIIWNIPVQRSWAQRFLRYSVLLVLGPILLGASIGVTSLLMSFVGSGGFLQSGLSFLLLLVPYAFSSILFFLMYRYLPHTVVKSSAAWRGGLITGLSFEILKQGFAFYAHYALTTSMYGSLATLPILVIWISLVATIILIGGEITCFFDQPNLF